MTRKRARLYGVLALVIGVAVAAALILTALKDNVSYFHTPTELLSGDYAERRNGHSLRLGGLVEEGSLKRDGDRISFRITDLKNSVGVVYEGMVPDLFREGQGVIAEGKMGGDQTFVAASLLAKHDEKYMPPEVAAELKQSMPAKP